MELQKLKSKLKSNGVDIILSNDGIKIKPVELNQLKYLLISALGIPAILAFVFITGPSLLGLTILGAGISCSYNGVKSRRDLLEFNSSSLEISSTEVILKNTRIPIENIERFKAGLSTNPLFPNIKIEIQTHNDIFHAFTIWRSNKKYLNEDKYEIVEGLNHLIKISLNK